MAKMVAIRDSFGEALVELGRENPDVVVLDADISASTKTVLFGKAFPDRFFNFGIAEANMMDAAAGFAAAGKIPFASTFGFLATLKAGEQLRSSIAYPKLNVKVCGGYGGLSDSYDGVSHHSIYDLAIMRATPNMTVIVASDDILTRKAVKVIAGWKGPVYLRLSRNEVPVLDNENRNFEVGKGILLREGTDVTIMVTGILVSKALEAADELKREGIAARVIEIHTLKPLDEEIVVKAAQETKGIVTVEEHTVIGGLGSAVAECLVKHHPARVEMVGIRDTFAESGPYDALLEKYILTNHAIQRSCRKLLDQ
ncbi:MAG: transketolase family protein [Deltaproteobacteria bacterium]|nr:transketolase family protein [Deltaproteobacteria bacterium]